MRPLATPGRLAALVVAIVLVGPSVGRVTAPASALFGILLMVLLTVFAVALVWNELNR
jgi:hypothetical protein